MTQREKLIELLKEASENHVCGYCESFTECRECVAQCEADYLLANGVVVLPCRCGGCDHHHWEQDPCHGKTVHYCDLPNMRGVEVYKDFFCGFAKRKGGDE